MKIENMTSKNIRKPVASLMRGVTEDILALIRHFAAQKTWSYKAFKASWSAYEFHYIYSGRHNLIELENFTRELLIQVKSFCQPGGTFFERVGALYAMYTLYLVQPLLIPVKIRMEIDEFNSMRSLVDSLKSYSVQPAYCFYVLLKKDAFHFVYSTQEFCAEKLRRGVPDSETLLAQSPQVSTRKCLNATLDESHFDRFVWMTEESSFNKHKTNINAFLGDQNDAFEFRDFLTCLDDTLVSKFNLKKNEIPITRKKITARRLSTAKAKKTPNEEVEEASENQRDEIMDQESLPQL